MLEIGIAFSRPKAVFVGNWSSSKMIEGNYNYSNGATYVGSFLDGKMHGKGVFKYMKTIYEGDYVEGMLEIFQFIQLIATEIQKL
jgi:hypothetical protein